MRIILWLALIVVGSCNSSSSDKGEAVTFVVGEDRQNAVRDTPQSSLPADYKKITFSTYAQVTPAAKVEIVLLVDTELTAEQNLAEGIDSLLEHIINSNWHIAVAALDTTAYPTKFISKYANYTDYGKQFATAINASKAPATTGQTSHTAGQAVTLRAFIIITDKSFTDTKLADNQAILAEEEHAPLTKAYAILNTGGNLDGYLNWQNTQGKYVISRYGSLQANYKKVLEEFSADIANTLRGIFVIPPLPPSVLQERIAATAGQEAGEDKGIAQVKVFNAPDDAAAQNGFIHDSHYQVKQNTVFTRTKLSEGTCVDVTLAK